MANIFQRQVVPQKPKVLSQERVYVYMPAASEDGKGLAAFNPRDFNAPNGYASLRWPMEMLIETLADPTVRPSFVKVTNDEFLRTNNIVTVTNPATGVSYSSSTAEIKLNRENRNALARPDLVMLDKNDFEEVDVIGPNGEQYNSYRIKRNNPFNTPALIQINDEDFVKADNIVNVSWPYAHDSSLGTSKTNGYGLIRIDQNKQGSLSFDTNNNLQVDTEALKQNMSNYLATRVTYGESDVANWSDRDKYIDTSTGLAKRDSSGNTLIAINKEAVGLNKVENIAFSERTYDMFGQEMKDYFTNQFNLKLNKSTWDKLFSDWAPFTADRNTVQKWFMRLEEEDNSIWSSIRTMGLFLGFFRTVEELKTAHSADATLLGSNAYVVETISYWTIAPKDANRYYTVFRDNTGLESITGQSIGSRVVNLNNGNEYVWNGTSWDSDGKHPEAWEWVDTGVKNLDLFDYVETDANALQPNAPVANVSVGVSGKWIQSDHIHPSDPTKLDADLIENAIIQITTTDPTNNDFVLHLAKVTIYNSNKEPIEATIVTTSQYLSSILDPQTDDLAIARNNGHIYKYNGQEWIYTNEVGTISYDTDSTVNIPYVKTGQYIHNWKKAPSLFTQDVNSNEGYWAGSELEFEALNLEDFPNNFMFHVMDEEGLEPSDLATSKSLDEAGITLTDAEYVSTDRLVIVDRAIDLTGKLLTIASKDIIPGTRGERRYLEPYNFGNVQTNPTNARMAVTITDENGNTILSHRSFTANKIIQSDAQGNLQASTRNSNDIVIAYNSLAPNKVVLGNGGKSLTTFDSGNVNNRPMVANGSGGIKTLSLTPYRVVVTGVNGSLASATWLDSNLLKSSNGTTESILTENKVLLSGGSNTVKTWSAGNKSAAGSLIVRGLTDGEITVKQWNSNNRLLYSSTNGTIGEIGLGTNGQYLVSTGEGVPSWIDGPKEQFHLPQTVLYSNPTEADANNFKGLVAIILDSTPEVTELRNNCIYYY